jgi:hypothetical protein
MLNSDRCVFDFKSTEYPNWGELTPKELKAASMDLVRFRTDICRFNNPTYKPKLTNPQKSALTTFDKVFVSYQTNCSEWAEEEEKKKEEKEEKEKKKEEKEKKKKAVVATELQSQTHSTQVPTIVHV